MQYKSIEYKDLSTLVTLAFFESRGVTECHASIELSFKMAATAQTQYSQTEETLSRLMKLPEFTAMTLVWKRYFASDAINQASFINSSSDSKVAVSIVQQQPLNGTKVVLLAYFVSGSKVEGTATSVVLKRPDYEHYFNMQMHSTAGNVAEQTTNVFETYTRFLQSNGCTLKDNAIRTWIYIQDIDVQYAGMVTSRNNIFKKEGLTRDTHFIASTGIEGHYICPEALMEIDAYAIKGVDERQIKHLHAATHLNPTYEYGVSFERGTAVDYGDRRHVYISGTASIDNKGRIVYPLDVEKQTERTLENIKMLLKEADTSMNDVGQMTVYLRDIADYQVIKSYFDNNYAQIPKVIVLAPVCRPGWLIEVECIAIKNIENKSFKPF